MPTVEELLGPRPVEERVGEVLRDRPPVARTVDDILGPPPADSAFAETQEPVEPFTPGDPATENEILPYFDIDRQMDEEGLDATQREGVARALYPVARPWIATGYTAWSAFNRGAGHFYGALDAMAEYAEDLGAGEKGGLFEKLAKTYDTNAEYWKERAEKVGISFVEELIGEAAGGAPYGIAEFLLNVPYAAAVGAAEAHKREGNPVVTALVEGAKRGTLGFVFRLMGPLNHYLRATAMGGVFGLQTAAEGAPPSEIGKAIATGAIYSRTSQAGQMGVSDVIRNLRRRTPKPRVEVAEKDTLRSEPEVERISEGKERVEQVPARVVEEPGVKRPGQMTLEEYIAYQTRGARYTLRPQDLKDLRFRHKQEVEKEQARAERPVALELEPTEAPPTRPLVEEFPDRKPESPEIRERKYWRTVEEAERTVEGAKAVMKEIDKTDPKINIVEPNRQSLEGAYKVLESKGFEDTVQHTLTSKELRPVEKSALYTVLMEDAQRRGDLGRFTDLVDSYSLYLAELGRGVQLGSVWTKRGTAAGFIRWAEKKLDAVNKKRTWFDTLLGQKQATLTKADKEHIAREFTRLQKMPEGPEKAAEFLKLVDTVALKVPPGVSELIDAYRYQNMLSGPQTQMRNIGWNMLQTFLTRPAELALEGSVDFVGAGLRGKHRVAYTRDVPRYYKDMMNAVPNAVEAFKNSWRMRPGETIGKPEIGIETTGVFEQARARQLPKVLTITQRFMEASDRFYAMLIASAEQGRLRRRGRSDVEAAKEAQELAAKFLLRNKLDPSDPTLSYFSRVLEGLGKVVQDGRKLPVIGKPMGWFIPFIRTPIKVGVANIERSPLGWAGGWAKMDKKWKADPTRYREQIKLAREQNTEKMARLIGGSMVTTLGAVSAYLGEVTWAPPSDPKQKELFYATGRKPFSFKYKEKWYPLWYLGPYALAFAFPAAIKHYSEETNQSLTDSDLEKIGRTAEGLARFLSSQTSAQSIGNFFAFMSGDIDYQIQNQLGFTLGQTIPAQAMVRYVNKAVDPVYRKTEGVWEQMMKDVPLLSQNLPPRYTPFMDEAQRDWFNMLLPYEVGVAKEEYEGMYEWGKMERRNLYLESQMDKLIRKMGEGDLRDKHMEELEKIFDAAPKIFKE